MKNMCLIFYFTFFGYKHDIFPISFIFIGNVSSTKMKFTHENNLNTKMLLFDFDVVLNYSIKNYLCFINLRLSYVKILKNDIENYMNLRFSWS